MFRYELSVTQFRAMETPFPVPEIEQNADDADNADKGGFYLTVNEMSYLRKPASSALSAFFWDDMQGLREGRHLK